MPTHFHCVKVICETQYYVRLLRWLNPQSFTEDDRDIKHNFFLVIRVLLFGGRLVLKVNTEGSI